MTTPIPDSLKQQMQALWLAVATHLLKQGAVSVLPGSHSCQYRAPSGLKCAIGGVLPDSLYKTEMEGCTTKSSLVWSAISEVFFPGLPFAFKWESCRNEVVSAGGFNEPVELARLLQEIHDTARPYEWPRQLAIVAETFGLDSSALSTLQNNCPKP